MIRIWLNEKPWYREVKPMRKVVIPGYEEYEFYATRDIVFKSKVNITEGKTGEVVGRGGNSIKKAIASAVYSLQKYTKDELNAKIERALKRHQLEMAGET